MIPYILYTTCVSRQGALLYCFWRLCNLKERPLTCSPMITVSWVPEYCQICSKLKINGVQFVIGPVESKLTSNIFIHLLMMEHHIYTSIILRGLYEAPNVVVKCSKNALIPDKDKVSSAPKWICRCRPIMIDGTDHRPRPCPRTFTCCRGS